LCGLISQLSFISLFSIEMLFDCVISGLYLHVSETYLTKFDFCEFSSVFRCFNVERPDCSFLASGKDLIASGRTWPASGGRLRLIVWTRATSLLISEAARVRTVLIHHPDGDPTEAINSPARRSLSTIPHKIPLFGSL